MSEQIVIKNVMVNINVHARPSAKIIEILDKFTTTLQIVVQGKTYLISSILDLLALNINKGSVLTLIFNGKKAQSSAQDIINILDILKQS